MSSQISQTVKPQRARGIARVEALLDAAQTLFEEKGYEKTTMTEIAERSDTAIGSLYRFFPTKDLLGETLVKRFAERSQAQLDDVLDRASTLSAEALADALVDTMAGRSIDGRVGALAVLDAHAAGLTFRQAFRAQVRNQVVAVLRRANPRLDPDEAIERALVLIYASKGLNRLKREEPRHAARTLDQQRRLFRLYVTEILNDR